MKKLIINSKIYSDYFSEDSIKLLHCYSKKVIPLSFMFICSYCYGILINPFKCKKCQHVYCEKCLKIMSILLSKCFCSDFIENNFEKTIIPNLLSTKYNCEIEKSTKTIINAFLYPNALENISNINPPFLKIILLKSNEEYTGKNKIKKSEKIIKIINHSQQCQFTLNCWGKKELKMFNYIKNCSLSISKKTLCKFDALKLMNEKLKFRQIKLLKCNLSIEFVSGLCKIIVLNKNRINNFMLEIKKEDTKIYFIIFKSLMATNNLKSFSFINQTNQGNTEIIDPQIKFPFQMFNVLLIPLKKLVHLGLTNVTFSAENSLDLISRIPNIKSLDFSFSYFYNDAFFGIIAELFQLKYLMKLNLSFIEGIFTFQKYEDTELVNILLHNVKITSVKIAFSKYNSKFIDLFLAFLGKNDTIKRLKIYLENHPNQLFIGKMASYIQSTKVLKSLTFGSENLTFFDQIISSLNSNDSIQKLKFNNVNFSFNSRLLVRFILQNKFLNVIDLSNCHLSCDLILTQSLALNQTLQLVILDGNSIERDALNRLQSFKQKQISLKNINLTSRLILSD